MVYLMKVSEIQLFTCIKYYIQGFAIILKDKCLYYGLYMANEKLKFH